MANIKQVANLAGVSTATVSKYLNGVQLKEANRLAVEAAIKELDYKINPTAQGLRTGKSMTIGILIPELDNLFSTSIVSIIENNVMQRGYSTIICDYKSDKKLELEKLQFLINRKVDGIVVMPYHISKKDLAGIDIPMVFIDRNIENADLDYVLVDNRKAAYNATTHLIENGHKEIAVLLGEKHIYTANERFKGYMDAYKAHSLAVKDKYILNGEYTIKSGHDLTEKLLKYDNPPTAIFATNYELTLGAVIALNEHGIDIPNQISVVGFDNLEMAKVIKPNITIVTQPINEIADSIAHTLLNKIYDNSQDKITTVLDTELIVQKSVKNIK